MNPITGGRVLLLLYMADRTSVATTPLKSGEPNEKSRSSTPMALKRSRHLAISLTGKRTEPAQTNEPDFLALFAHLADCDLDRRRQCSHAQQNDFRIFGHVLFEERVAVLASKRFFEVGIDFANHIAGDFSDCVVLPPNFHHPIFVGLWGHRNNVVGMEQQIAAVVGRQELLDLLAPSGSSPGLGSG